MSFKQIKDKFSGETRIDEDTNNPFIIIGESAGRAVVYVQGEIEQWKGQHPGKNTAIYNEQKVGRARERYELSVLDEKPSAAGKAVLNEEHTGVIIHREGNNNAAEPDKFIVHCGSDEENAWEFTSFPVDELGESWTAATPDVIGQLRERCCMCTI